ncbi:solute carrier family 23 member 1-like isoform X3 [Lethenteron reissneri]|uniref:solute carrier family 23 member 1-like isoform X3 n=2 Tax=Lethenteron reissneri TaxID=7753 RepID=UPI002AB7A486|nr:solute carrier family 23 member 1-like isoform X3 [Lethenteron reissneri]
MTRVVTGHLYDVRNTNGRFSRRRDGIKRVRRMLGWRGWVDQGQRSRGVRRLRHPTVVPVHCAWPTAIPDGIRHHRGDPVHPVGAPVHQPRRRGEGVPHQHHLLRVRPVHSPAGQLRRQVQGAVLVASTVEIVLGFSGLVGFVLRFVGPLCVAPTVSLIGLSLFKVASNDAGTHWGISAMTVFLIVLFSQYMKNLALPIPTYNKGCRIKWFQAFKLLPVLLAMGISWLLCYILTVCDVFPSDPQAYGHVARTDVRAAALQKSPWFRFPYPGQWGAPTVSAAGVLGILAGIVSSIVESVGDYYACARLVGAPPPPRHAVNRGIGMEGIGCLLAGAWGTGNGTTSYSENIGAIGITKVGSRLVIVTAGAMMVLLGMLGKVGAVFVTIPTPVIGGMFMVTFGIITAIGVSNLQFVDMNSTRNIFIFGFSTFAGLAVPGWLMDNPDILRTGVRELDQILQVLLTTSMFVGGFLGLLLDVTIPGTEEERGLLKWRSAGHSTADGGDVGPSRAERLAREQKFYGLPFRLDARLPRSWARWLPFWPPADHVGESEGPREAAADTGSIPVDLIIANNAIVMGNVDMNS